MNSTHILDLSEWRTAINEQHLLKIPAVEITRAVQWRKSVLFSIPPNLEDPIVRQHKLGQFYETKELQSLRAIFPEGGVLVDIGANAGNHSVFAGIYLKPSKIIPVEPNPISYSILLTDIVLNNIAHLFDLRFLGIGASDKKRGGYAMEKRNKNIGATRMLPGEGTIEVLPGDDILKGIVPNLIKIDVEGMELEVLNGLEATVLEHRPSFLVEIDNSNEPEFMAWVAAHRYSVKKTFVRYRSNKNHIIVPEDV